MPTIVTSQGRSGNGSGSTGASWSSSIVQSSHVGRYMIAAILHEEVASDWIAVWRPGGSASGADQTLTVIREIALNGGLHRLRISALANPTIPTSGAANIHLSGTSTRFLGYTAYVRDVAAGGVISSGIVGSDTLGQADPKTISGIVTTKGQMALVMAGVIGLRNGSAVAPMTDLGNHQQNGTGTDTSMDIGAIIDGLASSASWNYGASHHWAMGYLVLDGLAPATSPQAVIL